MGIKYDSDLNSELRRIVKNFNQKRNRAYKRGFSYLPNKQYVSTIKSRFDNRSDLRRYMRELERFNKLKDSALETVETLGGGRTSRWNLMFIKDNLKDTKAFFDRQIEEARELFYDDQFSIARREYLFNLEQKRKYLEMNIMTLDQSGIKTFEKYTRQALESGKTNITAYKGFLSGIEQLMRQLGYDEKTISSLYDKMGNLSPAQFVKMYRKNDLIAKLYDIIPSPSHGKSVITTGDEEAEELIDKFLKDVEKDAYNAERLSEFAKLTGQVTKEEKKYGKLKKSELTQEQLKELETLGWMDLVDENA